MTVKQLMENLAKCNPNATVCVEVWQEPEAKMIGEYIIDRKPYVYIGDDLEELEYELSLEETKYKITLYIYPITDCGKDLSRGEPLEVSYEATDLDALKRAIDWTIIETMKMHKANGGETLVEMEIEKNDEYYDRDEAVVFVDLKNNRVKYNIV